MTLTLTILLHALMGAFGGLLHCTLYGGFCSPCFDPRTKAWRPGWIGQVFLSTAAALLIWCNYNPAAFRDLSQAPTEVPLSLAQLAASVTIGIASAQVLGAQVRKALPPQ